MNISIFTKKLVGEIGYGGMETYLQGLIKGLEEKGCKITLNDISSNTDIILSQEFAYDPWDWYQYKNIPYVIIMHGVSRNLAINVSNSRGKIFYFPMLLYTKYLDWKNGAERKLLFATKIISVSKYIKEQIVKDYGMIPSYKIEVIPNGVIAHLPEKRFPPKGDTHILYVGRMSTSKGAHIAIKAMESLPKNFYLHMVGDGYLREKLERKVQKDKLLKDRVKFYGQKTPEELKGFYQEADIFFFPTLCYEGCPMAVLEAMSWGLPVAATSVCGTEEIILSGVDGYLETMERIKESPQHSILQASANIPNYSWAGHANVKHNFSLQKMIDRTYNLLQKSIK